ncbi:MAG: metallopeptidase family protein [Chloroflexi bacterium]|nr:metallopeptidase family protein [Chloroflexota bacterium]
MLPEKFERLVIDTVAGMPAEFKEMLDNIDICIQDWPSGKQLKSVGLRDKYDLLGLYEGTPRTRRDQNYNLVLPDKITIFQKPLEAQCRSTRELKEEIVRTVKHEIAHYFGLDDDRLDEIENRAGR